MKLKEKFALKSLLLPSVSLFHIRLHRVHPMSHEICCTCLPKWWLLVSIQTFDVELSFYLGLDPKELAFKHTSVVDWYTCPSKVGAFKQYIKLFCWCVRFLQLSLQVRGADIYPPDLCTEKRCSPTDLRSGQAANQMPNCTMVSPAPRAIVAARCYLMRCC